MEYDYEFENDLTIELPQFRLREVAVNIGKCLIAKLFPSKPPEHLPPPLPDNPQMPAIPIEPPSDMTAAEYLNWILSNYVHDEQEYRNKLYGRYDDG